MRRLPPHLAPLGYSPRRYLPLSTAPVLGMGERLTDLREMQLLFSNGEHGGYWPADPVYAFEDSAGTTPASVGGVVGLRLNAIAGYPNAVQATTGNKPYLRLTPTSNKPWYDSNTATGAMNVTFASALGRRNLLTYTEDFSNAAWGKYKEGTGSYPVVTNNYALAPDGTMTAIRIQLDRGAGDTGSDNSILRQVPTIINGKRSVWVKSNTGATQTFRLIATDVNHAVSATTEWVRVETDPSAAQFDFANYGPTLTTRSVDILVWHPQIEEGTTPTEYQKIVAGPSAVLDPTALAATYPQNISASTNCTIACVTPEGVVIADNQTVGTTFNICPPYGYNSDVLIINRALTPAEKTLVTRVMQRSVPTLGSDW